MTRITSLVLLTFLLSIGIHSKIQAQSLFLEQGQSGFSVNATGLYANQNFDVNGLFAYNGGGKWDLGVFYGTANLGDQGGVVGSTFGPSISFIPAKEVNGFNLSLDIAYAFFSFDGRGFEDLQRELRGFSIGTSASKAVQLGQNNNMYPFIGVAYSDAASAASLGFGVRFALGMMNENVFNLGPGISFIEDVTTVSFGVGVMFTGRKDPQRSTN